MDPNQVTGTHPYHAFPPQDEAYPPQGQPYPPQGQPYPPQGQPYPPQGQPYPPQGQPYPPPFYDYKAGQPGYDYQPQPATSTNTTTVVALQPKTTTTAYVSPPAEDSSGIAICALVFSIFTLLCCGLSLICLAFSIPALILAIVALGSSGSAQKKNAGISIGLNVAVVICTVLFLAIVIPVNVVNAASSTTSYSLYARKHCSGGYSFAYDTYCFSYYVCSTCSCTYTTASSFCP